MRVGVTQLEKATGQSKAHCNSFMKMLVTIGAIQPPTKSGQKKGKGKQPYQYDLSTLGDFDFDAWRLEVQESIQNEPEDGLTQPDLPQMGELDSQDLEDGDLIDPEKAAAEQQVFENSMSSLEEYEDDEFQEEYDEYLDAVPVGGDYDENEYEDVE